MNHILRPLPFVLASTNIGTMIINHCDRHSHPVPNPANQDAKRGGGAKTPKKLAQINQITQVLA